MVARQLVTGDVADAGRLREVVDQDDISVFHLASMVSAECEVDFDAALRVNLDGGRAVLEACRARGSRPRLVFSSSIAAFGGLAPSEVATDSTKLTPATTYGTTKAICELLVNDYTRKGFLDGRTARLPTVVIRPGRPNAAASSWVSGIFRERLNGEECIVPVDPGTRVPLAGYRTVVENLVRLHELGPKVLGSDRGTKSSGARADGPGDDRGPFGRCPTSSGARGLPSKSCGGGNLCYLGSAFIVGPRQEPRARARPRVSRNRGYLPGGLWRGRSLAV